jgi:hypothetical protein
MNSPLPLRLGVALLLATTSLPLPAADVPKLISQPTARTLTTSPKETAEQKAARHVLEMQAAEAKITALKQTLPLLTGPNADAQLAVFQAELLKLKDHPDFKPPRPAAPKAGSARPPNFPTAAQFYAARREADLALMRRQADKVLETRPELRDYVEQQFKWHRSLFELGGQYLDNPKVHQLIRGRLGATPAPRE